MILVDQALEEREKQGRPVKVGLIGAGLTAIIKKVVKKKKEETESESDDSDESKSSLD